MPAAVLFDWGDTLMRWAYDAALVEAGHRAGLARDERDSCQDEERDVARMQGKVDDERDRSERE
ncbi:MAG: hypothetical protein E6G25_01125 [Actinobacteria bacterium]|nr:MAG: hypothetical protein E6G25_01125 [Actinomycetota bacterium]